MNRMMLSELGKIDCLSLEASSPRNIFTNESKRNVLSAIWTLKLTITIPLPYMIQVIVREHGLRQRMIYVKAERLINLHKSVRIS